ncbi:pyridoxal phosphate-dependent aminotransferase [Thalassotalea castellviae]|uniref:Pyridoxal phosphate-dependent aminotransferase n=1 Tax=Thalassotalea castellviae TaxID=3075612 RepID=A0ABU3A0I0_9GAMM|nr:pyridoxal phosphate-dependent aminotransferase [Thalassotalea sp. W431]MDT0603047.1 pyridoxal phosphate-dependent aminotransferase [Thalassotalea sp. W431]
MVSHQPTQDELPAHLQFTQSLTCPIHGSLSDSTAHSLTLGQLVEMSGQGLEKINALKLGYASLKGRVSLRTAIVNFHHQLNHHQSQLNEDNVLTFCGAQEALSAIYQSLLQPGDEVIVVTPNYPSLTQMAEKLGCKVKTIELSSLQKWQFTIEDIKTQISAKTQLIVLNSPHNPTGSIIDSSLAEQLLTLAKAYDCYLIADDVSQASNYNNLALSHRYLDYDKALVVSVMSKSFGLAGIRIGWVISNNEAVLEQLLVAKSLSSICCSAIDEELAEIAFEQSAKIIRGNNQLIQVNIEHFNTFVQTHSDIFQWHPPQAGLLSLVEVMTKQPIELWARRLAEHTGILALPATMFGQKGQYFRLGLGKNNFKNLLTKLDNYLR